MCPERRLPRWMQLDDGVPARRLFRAAVVRTMWCLRCRSLLTAKTSPTGLPRIGVMSERTVLKRRFK